MKDESSQGFGRPHEPGEVNLGGVLPIQTANSLAERGARGAGREARATREEG